MDGRSLSTHHRLCSISATLQDVTVNSATSYAHLPTLRLSHLEAAVSAFGPFHRLDELFGLLDLVSRCVSTPATLVFSVIPLLKLYNNWPGELQNLWYYTELFYQ